MRAHLRAGASVLAFLLAAAAGEGVRADIYRWTDEKGQIHFTSDPSLVPARYRDQSATPADSKSTFNQHEAAPQETAPRQAPPRVPRIRTDSVTSERPRMQTFEEKPAEATPESPQKYFRDCNNPSGKCKSHLNADWVRWNEERKAKEAAAAQE